MPAVSIAAEAPRRNNILKHKQKKSPAEFHGGFSIQICLGQRVVTGAFAEEIIIWLNINRQVNNFAT